MSDGAIEHPYFRRTGTSNGRERVKLGITNSSVSGNPGVPGYSVSQTEPPSLRHPVSTEIQLLRFQDGREDPVLHGLGVAQGAGVPLARPQLGKDAAASRDPSTEDSENVPRPPDPSGPKVAFVQPLASEAPQDPEEEEDDDRDSVADPPVMDKILSRLFNLISDKFANSRPLTNVSAPPRCEFAKYFAISDLLVRIFGSTPGFMRSLTLAPRKLPI